MSKVKVKKIVRAYTNLLKGKKFPFAGVYLYGSYARGNAHRWSDIDICVVSPRFRGSRWDEYERQLWHWTREVDTRIEPFGMSPEEFRDPVSPLAHEVRTTGIKVA